MVDRIALRKIKRLSVIFSDGKDEYSGTSSNIPKDYEDFIQNLH